MIYYKYKDSSTWQDPEKPYDGTWTMEKHTFNFYNPIYIQTPKLPPSADKLHNFNLLLEFLTNKLKNTIKMCLEGYYMVKEDPNELIRDLFQPLTLDYFGQSAGLHLIRITGLQFNKDAVKVLFTIDQSK